MVEQCGKRHFRTLVVREKRELFFYRAAGVHFFSRNAYSESFGIAGAVCIQLLAVENDVQVHSKWAKNEV